MNVSVVRRVLPLFFAFNKAHYSRWCSLYFEDCLASKSTYPDIFDCFINEVYVVAQSLRKESRIPVDMAVDKQYFKLAKKGAVCKWNLIRYEKLLYTLNLEFLCHFIVDDEYKQQQEFFPFANKADKLLLIPLLNISNERRVILIFLMTMLQISWLVSLLILKIWCTPLQLLKWCTASLNYLDLIKKLLSCLTQSQEQKL